MADPGWRADPTGRFELRWFDGRRWTKRVRVGDAVAIDTLSVPNDLQPPPDRAGTAPGWRPDPDAPGRERFHDGHGWTAATRDGSSSRPRPGIRAWPLPRVVVVALIVLAAIVAIVGIILALVV